jgi:hypothetical protein
MRRPLAILPIALAALVAGCGQTDSSTEFRGADRQVANVIEDLQEAAIEGEERRICRQLLSAELARGAGDCNRAVQAAIDEADTNEIEVEDVSVTGDRARARVRTGTREKQTETYELVRENRTWRISSLGGS